MPPMRDRATSRYLTVALPALVLAFVSSACSYAMPTPPVVAGPATWWLDPAFAEPGPDTVELPVLVEERACASGRSAEGRIAAPVIELDEHTVRITIGVLPAPGEVQSCQGNPPTPFVVVLPEPLGARGIVGDIPVPH